MNTRRNILFDNQSYEICIQDFLNAKEITIIGHSFHAFNVVTNLQSNAGEFLFKSFQDGPIADMVFRASRSYTDFKSLFPEYPKNLPEKNTALEFNQYSPSPGNIDMGIRESLLQKEAKSKTLIKRTQHFTEQCKTFMLGEMLDSFDHLLYCARCCSTLFDGNQKC